MIKTIAVVFTLLSQALLAQTAAAKSEKKWIPAAVQNFALTGHATAGEKQTPVTTATVQMQGDEILSATVAFATDKETKFVLKTAETIPNAKSGDENYILSGELTFNEKTETVHFPAKITNSDQNISATVQAVLPDKTPVSIHVTGSKASKTRSWTNSSD